MSIYFRLCRFFSNLSRPQRGFTIIELLVVSVIIVLITSAILIRQQGFNSSTLLRSLSYSIALSVRQAQVYGVSVRETTSGAGTFADGYGVYFGNTGLVDHNHYLLFADKGNGILDSSTPDANGNNVCDTSEDCLVQRFTIGNGRSAGPDYTIRAFCAHTIGGSTHCSTTGSSPLLTHMTIYFRRPNPDACFATNINANACAPGAAAAYDYAYVQLRSNGSSDYRTIKVTNTGQIAVCKQNLDAAGVAAC